MNWWSTSNLWQGTDGEGSHVELPDFLNSVVHPRKEVTGHRSVAAGSPAISRASRSLQPSPATAGWRPLPRPGRGRRSSHKRIRRRRQPSSQRGTDVATPPTDTAAEPPDPARGKRRSVGTDSASNALSTRTAPHAPEERRPTPSRIRPTLSSSLAPWRRSA